MNLIAGCCVRRNFYIRWQFAKACFKAFRRIENEQAAAAFYSEFFTEK
jgi:hypothetical protein